MAALPPLPIDPFLPDIARFVRERRALVVTAAPGAGKTTRVPPTLVGDGPVLLLQPRRVAARAIARRIADERQWTLGREVGWHVRFDRRTSADTRLTVVTEGILTARLQQDPLLSDIATVVIDEFHERSLNADLGLALARQAWLARDDFRIVVMSATLDAARVAAFLGNCPVVDVPGRTHPIDVRYRPGVALEDAVRESLGPRTTLCFLPGAPEIRRAAERLSSMLDGRARVQALHGGLDPDEQDAAIAPSTEARVILATNIAETTLTVPDVRVVVDTGLHKVARYDADRLVDSLDTERITGDSADQRAGRAGRTAPGVAVRLWDARDRLRPHREPEIARVDLASVVLDVMAWGGDPRTFEWFEAPPAHALDGAVELLRALGALDAKTGLSPLGHQLRRLPVHPRLGGLLLQARAAPQAALACAILSERHFLPPAHGATTCDLLSATDRERDLPPHVSRVARDIRQRAAELVSGGAVTTIDEADFRRAVLAGYPDRVARRREAGSDRFLLASGTGARLARSSGVINAEFVVAVDVTSATPGPKGPGLHPDENLIRIATSVDHDWLAPTSDEVEHLINDRGAVRASRVLRYGELEIGRRPADVDPEAARELISKRIIERGPGDDDQQLLARLSFAGIAQSFDTLVAAASAGARAIDEVDLLASLPYDVKGKLDRDAPASLALPAGRRARLEYRDDGRVVASVKLQWAFGLTESPRLGPRHTPITFELLAPNGRPVQVTSDLKSFWAGVYPELRGALRARYPKHQWPDVTSG
jgi:ATP-dependent helicase HrpB